jgi:hypothetical protein
MCNEQETADSEEATKLQKTDIRLEMRTKKGEKK